MKLLHSIFRAKETGGRYPEALVDKAIDRAVEGTDPRVRLLPGYRRRLRAPVLEAIDHVVGLVDAIQAPVPATKAGYGADARLAALFASPAAMLQTLSRDAALDAFLSTGAGRAASQITALLLAERNERTVLGIAMDGDQVRRDVPQVTVSFAGHVLRDPAADEAETRRQLKRRAFDHMITLALERIAARGVERANLERQRDLLRRKLDDLRRGGWQFDAAQAEHTTAPAAIEADLEEIGAQLEALGAEQNVLKAHLDTIIETLSDARRQLWTEPVRLTIDAMNIRRDATDPGTRVIDLVEICGARGHRLALLPLTIDPRELPPQEDLVTAAQRYLY